MAEQKRNVIFVIMTPPRWAESGARALLAAIVLCAPLVFGCVEPWSQALLEAACFSLAGFCCFIRTPPALIRAPLSGMCIVLAIGLLQLMSSAAVFGAPQGRLFTAAPRATRESALLWGAYTALLWGVPRVVPRVDAARRLAAWIFVSGLLVAVVGLMQLASGTKAIYGLWYGGAGSDPFGPYYNCDHAASAMSMSFCMGAALFWSRLRAVGVDAGGALPADFIRTQAGRAALLLLLAAGLLARPSQGALLSLASAGWIIGILAAASTEESSPRRKAWAVLIAALAAGLAALYGGAAGSVGATGTFDTSITVRLALYESGLRMLRASPMFGWGLGSFPHAFAPFQDDSIPGIVDHIHNDWLELALDCGLVGLVAFALSIIVLWCKSALALLRADSGESRMIVAGALAAVAAYSLHGLVDFSMHVPANAALFLCIVGSLSACSVWGNKDRPPRGSQVRLRYVVAPLFAVLAVISCRPVIGAWYARRASLAPPQHRDGFLRKAAAWDRRPEYLYSLGLERLGAGRSIESLESALRLAREALKEEPFNSEYLWLEGAILWHLGRQDEARAALARAREFRFEPIAASEGPSVAESLEADLEALRQLKLLRH